MVSQTSHDSAAVTGRLSVRAVLGLHSTRSPQWPVLRALQYGSLADFGRYRLFAHLVGTVVVAWLVAGLFDAVVLWAWALMMGAILYTCIDIERSFVDLDERAMRRSEHLRHTFAMATIGLLWAGMIVYVAMAGALAELLPVIMVVMVLVTASAVALAAPALGTIVLIGVIGIASAAALLMTQAFELILIPVLFSATTYLGTIEKSRTFLSARIAEAGMQEKQAVVSLLLREHEESGADWLWEVDTRRRLRSVSPRFAYALGTNAKEAEGERFVELIAGPNWLAGDLSHSLHDLAERLKRRESFSALLVQVLINGEKRWWELSGTPMLDEQRRYIGFRGVGSDVTEKRESSEKIAFLARYDTLTALPNRLQLNEKLGEALRYASQWRGRCAFIMLDLDRFKAVNDTLGHMVGDMLLAEVATRLNDLCGTRAICGRLGGDEFGIVVRDLPDINYLKTLSKAIIQRLNEPFKIDGHTLYVGTSVGSAIGPRDGETVEELMRNADLALYQAKDDGGGEHRIYEPSLHAAAEERRKLEVSLRQALARAEMRLQYQPVVDANTEEVVSFEALARWDSFEHGPVNPVKFIPIAEDTRLIIPIGEWVLRQACLQAMEWPSHVMVNVNVSPAQLLEHDFNRLVQGVLDETGLPASRLEIEVTESVFLADANIAKTALESLIEMGCSIALDDFGTGYSSLGYLRTLRFSTIKVDRLFVKGASQGNRESLAIINAVVAMSDSLGMTTTAEGAETADEARLIRSLGCTKIQGYHFGRPMDAKDTARMLNASKAANRNDEITRGALGRKSA